ncbi:eukaryotic translation initiation factor 4B isoform X2 [Hetaerina americana]|uniref:eukaryotic translation initiation factor 4B isoform X2 n=1 Tax=Hetaerina americana TaxID=62018 RepID=UPI003A7F2D05
MAASGKKGKKTKGKTIALNEFLANKPDEPEPAVKPWKPNWAEEDVDEDFSYSRSRDKHVVLPTAPRAAREPGTIDESRIPNEAPFIAYISNLPYEVHNEDIAEFFKGLEIKNLRLPRDEGREGSKLKGFGYVEFEDRESLKEALHFANRDMKGRLVGVEVADGGDDRRRGGMGRDMRRGGMGRDLDGPDRTLGDWRSGPRDDDREADRDRGGFGFRDRGMDRGSDRGGPGGRREFGAGFWDRDREGGGGFRERDGMGFRDRDGGGFRERDGGGFREGGGGGFRDRDGGGFRERDGGGFRDRDGGGFRERDGGGFQERWGGDREMSRRDGDAGRRDMGFPRRGADEKDDGGPERDPARSRPKLNLAPRTKAPEEKKPDVAPVVASSSIFGGAKPVDTASREMEIEKRLARERGTGDGIPSAPSRNPESRPKSGTEDEEEEKPRKENFWVRRSQRATDENQGERRDLSSEKNRSSDDETPSAVEPHSGMGSSKEDVDSSEGNEVKGPSASGRTHSGATVRDNTAKMPEYFKEPAPNFFVSNKFAPLPDEDAADNSD